MAHEKNHDYHILNPSIWPFLSDVGAFILLLGKVSFILGAFKGLVALAINFSR